MNKRLLFFLIVSSLLLSGCWDQQLLKSARVITTSSFDLTDHNKILSTAIIRALIGAESLTAENIIVQAEGNTLRDTRLLMDRKLSGDFAGNKARVFVLGEKLVKEKELYPIFDIFYRDPRSSIGAKVIVVEGQGQNILKMKEAGGVLIGEEMMKLVESAESRTIIPVVSLQSLCTDMFDDGHDFMIPYIRKSKIDDGSAFIGERNRTLS